MKKVPCWRSANRVLCFFVLSGVGHKLTAPLTMIFRSAGPFFLVYAPTQLVAPRAVRMADAMDAISWITNFAVSFLVIVVV